MNQDNNQQITENNPDAMLEANYDCTNCGENVTVKDAVKSRPVPDVKKYTKLGLECPHCQHWEHSLCLTDTDTQRIIAWRLQPPLEETKLYLGEK